jgi:prepilin-type N-terminal cleavage/methylation domain-containing protein/prepilin-type processing-associated H-X9-DG protein
MTRITSRRRGFTLMELLVAIGIIAVLAAILFPVLAQVRRNARKVECLSHLHYIGLAMRLYISDHSGYFPNWCCDPYANPSSPPATKNAPDPTVKTWDMVLADYLSKPNGGAGTQPWQELVRCPDNQLPVTLLGAGATDETARAYTLARQTQRPNGVNFYGGYVSLIPNPAATVMIFEKGANLPGSWGDALGENVNQSHGTASDPASGYTDLPFHFGGKNILFVDGNVKWSLKTNPPTAAPANAWTGDPYAWNPVGSNGAGACERWGVAPAGDWPPLS